MPLLQTMSAGGANPSGATPNIDLGSMMQEIVNAQQNQNNKTIVEEK